MENRQQDIKNTYNMKKMTRYQCKKTMNDNRTRDLGDQDGL